MFTIASSFSRYLPASTPLISFKRRGSTQIQCCTKADREEARIKSELGTMYTRSRKERRKGNLPEAVRICEKKGEDLGFTISGSDWKKMLEKSQGGFVSDVYNRYMKTKTIVTAETKVETQERKSKKKSKKKPTNETVVNKREAGGEKGSDGDDLKNAEVNEGVKDSDDGESGGDGSTNLGNDYGCF